MSYFIDFDISTLIFNLVHIIIAFVLALPIAWNRENSHTRGAGLRTFPIVSIASCAFSLLGVQLFANDDAQARVIYGVMTGIGFIGGGAIIKDGTSVAGTATAASIWNTGAIGVCVANGIFEIAILLSLINFLILQFGAPLKKTQDEKVNQS